MASLNKVYFRADAYPAIGTGHVMRCLALANAVIARAIPTCFIGRIEDSVVMERIRRAGHELIALDADASTSAWLAATETSVGDWVVLDGYEFGIDDHAAIKKAGPALLVIDDTNELSSYLCDVLLNQNFYASDLPYSCMDQTRLLLGPRYALLRDEFVKSSPIRESRSSARLLVSLGGADPHGVGVVVMNALASVVDRELDVLVLAGSSSGHFAQIEIEAVKARKFGHRIEIQAFTDDMPGAMAWADVGLIGAGTTSLEVAYMGLPCLVLILADNQIKVANAMQEAGIAESFGWYEDVSPQLMACGISALFADVSKRNLMTNLSKKIVDGAGAQRVVDMMLGY